MERRGEERVKARREKVCPMHDLAHGLTHWLRVTVCLLTDLGFILSPAKWQEQGRKCANSMYKTSLDTQGDSWLLHTLLFPFERDAGMLIPFSFLFYSLQHMKCLTSRIKCPSQQWLWVKILSLLPHTPLFFCLLIPMPIFILLLHLLFVDRLLLLLDKKKGKARQSETLGHNHFQFTRSSEAGRGQKAKYLFTAIFRCYKIDLTRSKEEERRKKGKERKNSLARRTVVSGRSEWDKSLTILSTLTLSSPSEWLELRVWRLLPPLEPLAGQSHRWAKGHKQVFARAQSSANWSPPPGDGDVTCTSHGSRERRKSLLALCAGCKWLVFRMRCKCDCIHFAKAFPVVVVVPLSPLIKWRLTRKTKSSPRSFGSLCSV